MKRSLACLMGILALGSCDKASNPAAPTVSPPALAAAHNSITLVTQIDFSEFPFRGTFVVTEGAAALGCSAGTFVDTPTGAAIRKDFTCTAGGEGSFTFLFRPGTGNNWNVLTGSGDFSGLHGTGEFALACCVGDTGTETFTGTIHYAP